MLSQDGLPVDSEWDVMDTLLDWCSANSANEQPATSTQPPADTQRKEKKEIITPVQPDEADFMGLQEDTESRSGHEPGNMNMPQKLFSTVWLPIMTDDGL